MKLKDEEAHGHALTVPGAAPTAYGLGRSGWVSVPLTGGSAPAELLCDWVEESYRTIAPPNASSPNSTHAEGRQGLVDGAPRS
ncbi:hypothetical protein GCM10020000_14780 [Streptomyces olivoverticillatus]